MGWDEILVMGEQFWNEKGVDTPLRTMSHTLTSEINEIKKLLFTFFEEPQCKYNLFSAWFCDPANNNNKNNCFFVFVKIHTAIHVFV